MTFERSLSANQMCPMYGYMVHLQWELTPYNTTFYFIFLLHARHGRYLVENLKPANYDITPLTYAEMIKQKQNTMN